MFFMKPDALFEGLKELARQIGVNVRSETGKFTGGYCVLHNKRLIVINKRMPTESKVAVLAKSIAQFPLDDIYIKPALRDFIEDEGYKEAMHRKQREKESVKRETTPMAA